MATIFSSTPKSRRQNTGRPLYFKKLGACLWISALSANHGVVTHGQGNARPAVTFPGAGHHRTPASTKLYCSAVDLACPALYQLYYQATKLPVKLARCASLLINGRPGLCMAVRRRTKSVGADLAYGHICYLPALSVTYSAAAVAACGAI